MRLETAIRERWGSDGALAALLPVERVSIGPAAFVPALPYAVVLSEKQQPMRRTSSGTALEEHLVRFRIWTINAEQAEQIAVEIERVFERSDFSFTEGLVLNLQRQEQAGKPLPDGTWHATHDFKALVQRST